MERSFVSFGNLVLDVFYKQNGEINYVSPGGSKFNVIFNLAARNNKTKILTFSNNELSKHFETLFDKFSINYKILSESKSFPLSINHLTFIDGKEYGFSKQCPICQTKCKEFEISLTNYIKYIEKNDVLFFDNLNKDILHVMACVPNDIILDIGHSIFLELLTQEDLQMLNNIISSGKIKILQMSGNTCDYLSNNDDIEKLIFKNSNIDIVIRTFGEKGAKFTTKKDVYKKTLYNKNSNVVDATGLGDAFLSVFTEEYYKNKKTFIKNEPAFIDTTFDLSTRLTYKKSCHLGALGHLGISPYTKLNHCVCDLNK